MSHLNREPFHKHQNSPSLLNSGLERKVNGEILTVLKNHVQSICASKYCHQCLSLVIFDRFWGIPHNVLTDGNKGNFDLKMLNKYIKQKSLRSSIYLGL